MRRQRDYTSVFPRYAVSKDFYDEVRASRSEHKLIEKFTIPPNNGKGLVVRRGQLFRLITPEGPQVADVNLWNADNPSEFLRPERTFILEGWFITPYSRLWSDVPWFRPLATCTEDTVTLGPPKVGFHHHFIVASHCTPEMLELRSGRAGLNACHLNLLQAIEPFGLGENHIYDNFNAFQKARIDPASGKIYGAASNAKPGDFLEFYAEIDLLVAVSVCPTGDGLQDPAEPEGAVVRPIGVEVYETGIPPKEFPKWTDWRPTWQGKWMPQHGRSQ